MARGEALLTQAEMDYKLNVARGGVGAFHRMFTSEEFAYQYALFQQLQQRQQALLQLQQEGGLPGVSAYELESIIAPGMEPMQNLSMTGLYQSLDPGEAGYADIQLEKYERRATINHNPTINVFNNGNQQLDTSANVTGD